MQLLDRVTSNVNICAVELSFTNTSAASAIAGWQPFYNSIFENNSFEKTYATLGSLDFSEESETTVAGVKYKQEITFRFPASDKRRSERLALLQKIKYVKLKFNNSLDIVIGRNDFYQNTLPIIKIKTDHQLCEVKISSQSIFPCGFTVNSDIFIGGLAPLIPLTVQ